MRISVRYFLYRTPRCAISDLSSTLSFDLRCQSGICYSYTYHSTSMISYVVITHFECPPEKRRKLSLSNTHLTLLLSSPLTI